MHGPLEPLAHREALQITAHPATSPASISMQKCGCCEHVCDISEGDEEEKHYII